jgi:Uma2 family endonuclease
MVQSLTQSLTLAEFLALPESDTAYELIDGQAVLKMSPGLLSFQRSKEPAAFA